MQYLWIMEKKNQTFIEDLNLKYKLLRNTWRQEDYC